MTIKDFRTFIDNLGEFAAMPGGIELLKKTVLHLAISGQLVPQDPAEGTAEGLHQEIQAEKARLVREGKLKKQKELPPIREEEIPFEIPKSWKWVRLSEVFDVRDGTHDTPKYVHNGVPLVTSKNLSGHELNLTNIKYISIEDHEKISQRSKVDRGDILFAMIGSIGNPTIVNVEPSFSIKNIALFKPYSAGSGLIDTLFLKNYLSNMATEMRKSASGGVQPFVSLNYLRSYLFPLPPCVEQERISKQVEQYFIEIDQLAGDQIQLQKVRNQLVASSFAKATPEHNAIILKHLPELVHNTDDVKACEKYIFHLAISGQLVPQDPAEGTAEGLHQEIQAEKARLVREGKLKKQKELPPIREEEIPFEIPKSWKWVRLGNIGHINPRNVLHDNIDVTFLPMADIPVGHGKLHLTQVRKWKEVKSQFSHFAEGDVLMAKITPCFENGKSVVARGVVNSCGAGTTEIHVFRPQLNRVIPDYILLYLKSEYFMSDSKEKMTGTAGQKRVPTDVFANCLVPLPAEGEQKRIVEMVEKIVRLMRGITEGV